MDEDLGEPIVLYGFDVDDLEELVEVLYRHTTGGYGHWEDIMRENLIRLRKEGK